uniref:Glycoside hydrolase family 3 C-terminal domain-containing protein n=1 Tax=Leersia perrieri TaxID=77586 RepID=A0A0D9W4T4_9ORYZ
MATTRQRLTPPLSELFGNPSCSKNGKTSDKLLLPLSKKASNILVVGSHADNLGYQCGSWTIEWQGDTGCITVGTTILDAMKAAVDSSTTTVVYAEIPDAAFIKNGGFSYVIVVVGEQPSTRTRKRRATT